MENISHCGESARLYSLAVAERRAGFSTNPMEREQHTTRAVTLAQEAAAHLRFCESCQADDVEMQVAA